jgi:cryptochrome
MAVLHWFRKGLRVHDCPSLLASLAGGTTALFPVFVIDPWFANPARVCANRYGFLLETLSDLDASLRARGSRLFVVRGRAEEVIPRLAREWGITRIVFESDIEPYAVARDAAVEASLRGGGTGAGAGGGQHKAITVQRVHGHTLWEPSALLALSGGRIPAAYESFLKLTVKAGKPPRPFPPPATLPPPTPGAVPAGAHTVPTLSEMGYDPATVTTPFKGLGGESHGRARMTQQLARVSWVAAFAKPNTNPTALSPDTTALSPYLKFGAVGAREVYWGLQDAYTAARAAGRATTAPPVSLEGQMLWREFFYAIGASTPNFDRMEGNPICKQLAWEYNPDLILAWEEGRTGYPWIDAAMAQLQNEGWLHHLARHAVACFLTRGDLYQSWEHGARIFDKHLLDSDWALNNANWMWLSCSAFFYQFFRVYSPVAFAKKTDPSGEYIRKHLPQFKTFPAKFIYEPWTAPLAVQQAHGVIVGVSYPSRIVLHEEAHKAGIAKHSAGYAAAKTGGAAAVTAGVPAEAKGVGQTQVGSNPAAADAWASAFGVALGELPPGPGAGAGAGAGAAGPAAAKAGTKRKFQTELEAFYGKKKKSAAGKGGVGTEEGGAFDQDLEGAEDAR